MGRTRVSYFMDNDIGGYYYGEDHPMKPHRISMTHNLVLAYGLYRKMEVYRPRKAAPAEILQFHSPEYLSFLQRITPDNAPQHLEQLAKFNMTLPDDLDCPTFDGLFTFCQSSVGGSIDGARKLMSGTSDISINWSGGMHHAKKNNASGFCYTNDIVLAIIELLKYYPRVLYIDIDVHHGDGVEEAFYVTDRVMTVSFHKFGNDFFPMTGDIWDVGAGRGENYSVNCPLKDGINDTNYESIFKPIIAKVMEIFRPHAIVLQCGADSLCNDPLGPLNLTIAGHGKCVQFIKAFNIPTLVLGGGGYNIRSVARCWTYETGLLLDISIDGVIPYNDYWEYFAPDHKLHFPPAKVVDLNTRNYLTKVKEKIMENLKDLQAAPSVQMHEVPSFLSYSDDKNDLDPEKRLQSNNDLAFEGF